MALWLGPEAGLMFSQFHWNHSNSEFNLYAFHCNFFQIHWHHSVLQLKKNLKEIVLIVLHTIWSEKTFHRYWSCILFYSLLYRYSQFNSKNKCAYDLNFYLECLILTSLNSARIFLYFQQVENYGQQGAIYRPLDRTCVCLQNDQQQLAKRYQLLNDPLVILGGH